MSTKLSSFILFTIVLLAGGCVSQGQYDALAAKERRAQEQLVDLAEQLAAKNAELNAIRSLPRTTDPDIQAKIDQLVKDRDALQAALTAAEGELRKLAGQAVEAPILPTEIDQALKQLAANNPELMEYDARRGMIKLRSDLTFALGSTEISANGQAALQRLSSIINLPAAQAYDVKVVGHTDNVPVTNANNLRRFGDNWGLSAFRAISVKDVFLQAGVSPARVEIAGRGEYQPVVANGPRGAEQNRRVEIFLIRNGSGGAAAAATAAAAPAVEGPVVPPTTPKAAVEGPEAFK
jgi:chemotaxis protein MotB